MSLADQYRVYLPPEVIRSPIQDLLGNVRGSMKSHNIRWPSLGQNAEIDFAETNKQKKNDSESSQSLLQKTGLKCPASTKKSKKLKTSQNAVLVLQS